MNSIAKTTKHLQPVINHTAQQAGDVSLLETNISKLGRYYFLFALLESSGCRFNEVCTASWQQITSDGRLLINGLKGSNDRFIYDHRAARYLIKSRNFTTDPFLGMNIFTASRLLKSIGLQQSKKGRQKMTVTGIFRESYAARLREVSTDSLVISQALGHKSSSNSQYYGQG